MKEGIVIKSTGSNYSVIDNKKELFIIDGAKCKKGIKYSKNEVLNPKRILTTSILVRNGNIPLVSVKTSKSIPKDKIFEILKIIKKSNI